MQTLKGTPIYFGHRAWGSLFRLIFLMALVVALDIYLWYAHPALLHRVIFTEHVAITVEYVLWIIIAILFLILIYRHYRWTFLISSREIVVRKGIIASDVKTYLYDQIQQIDTFQTVSQRILLYGQMTVTMLITLTGQSKVEEATIPFIHRPKHLANVMTAYLKIGDR
jgi:membrane protein YdbS with pleckstrin-like domain